MSQCRVQSARRRVGARRATLAAAGSLILALALPGGLARQPEGVQAPGADAGVRFAAVHIVVDAGQSLLGAYQVDLRAIEGDVKVVGVEGAAPDEQGVPAAAFARAPYYDPAAMMAERVVIGDFSLNEALPSGRVRVATVHVRIAGSVPPRFEASVMAAADGNGKTIKATVTTELVQGGGS